MKKTITNFSIKAMLTCLLAFVGINQSNAQCNPGYFNPNASGGFNSQGDFVVGQSFTSTCEGVINYVEVGSGNYNQTNLLRIVIQQGDGNQGAVLCDTTSTVTSFGNGVYRFNLNPSSTLNVVAGGVYTFLIVKLGGVITTTFATPNNPYSGGNAYSYGNTLGFRTHVNLDLNFSVNIVPGCTPTTSTTDSSICPSALPFTWNGLTFNGSGSQTKTGLTNAAGCDSSATLNLSIKDNTTSDTTAAVCNSFTWHDSTYRTSGDYVWHTTNEAGCDSARTLHLTILSVSSTTAKTDALCANAANGTITITPTSGVSPYTYKLGTTGSYVNNNTFTGLRAGNYRVSILDANGCAGTSDQVTILQPPAITATTAKTDAVCNGSATGSIVTTPTSGIAPFTFRLGISGSYVSTNTFSNLKAGNYTIYILDGNSCPGTATAVVGQLPLVTGTASVTDATCNGTATGTVSITPTIGVSPFTYRLGTTGSFGTSNTFSALRAATYTIFIQDANGCIGNVKATVGQPVAVTATFTKTDVTGCNRGTNGSITVTPTTGIAPYSYKLNATGIYGSFNSFSGLKAGTYSVYVKDANSCEGIISGVIISQPTAVSAAFTKTDASCPGALDGSMTINGGGGTPPYTYRLGTSGAFNANNTFTKLKAGSYRVYVNDANGCTGYSIIVTIGLRATACFGKAATAKTNQDAVATNNRVEPSLSPNPTNNQFKLMLPSTGNAATVRVLDVNGKTLYTTKTGSQSITFGENFAPGVYMVEVRQGEMVKTLKAVKGR